MNARCCCGAVMEARALEEESPLSYHLRLSCTACANWMTASGRLEDITPLVQRTLWSNEARHELDRLPPYVEGLVREEVEAYAAKEEHALITVATTAPRYWGCAAWSSRATARRTSLLSSRR